MTCPSLTRFLLHLEDFVSTWTTVRYIKNFEWDPLWQALLSPYRICAVCLMDLPVPLSSLHPALWNKKLNFINRLPFLLASSWGSPKEQHQQELGEQEGGKVKIIILLAPSPDLCVLVDPPREYFLNGYPFPNTSGPLQI